MEISLFDLPEDKFFVIMSKEFNERFLDQIKTKFGSFRQFYIKHKLCEQTFFSMKRRREYPLILIKRFCKYVSIPLVEIQSNVCGIRSGRFFSKGKYRSTIIYPKFPIKLTPELSRMIAHMLGDGCITVNKRGHYNFQYYNKNKHLIEMFKSDSKKVFGDLHIHESVNKDVPYVFLPAPVTIIFLQMVKDFHSKSSRLPKFINETSLEIKIEFLRSIFDDEACVKLRKSERRIEFALANKLLVDDIRHLLNKLGIKTSNTTERTDKNGYHKAYFYIKNYQNIYSFWKLIGFYHPQKQEKLNMIMKFPGRKSYAFGETKELILKLLREQPLSVYELSERLDRTSTDISSFVRKLESENKIKRFNFNNKKLCRVIPW